MKGRDFCHLRLFIDPHSRRYITGSVWFSMRTNDPSHGGMYAAMAGSMNAETEFPVTGEARAKEQYNSEEYRAPRQPRTSASLSRLIADDDAWKRYVETEDPEPGRAGGKGIA